MMEVKNLTKVIFCAVHYHSISALILLQLILEITLNDIAKYF